MHPFVSAWPGWRLAAQAQKEPAGLPCGGPAALTLSPARFAVDAFGAVGNGVTLATDAINAAIAAASLDGGGLVDVPPGRYLCFTLHLRSNVILRLCAGAVLVAADPAHHSGAYDPPEEWGDQLYQDFGHSHWHNSLITGDGLENTGVIGPGLIDARALTRNGPGSRWKAQSGERPASMDGMDAARIAVLEPDHAAMRGLGNKAIALRNCRNVALRDLTISGGGHFAVLASGVDDLIISNLKIDAIRDGIDLDCVRRALVEHCRVNTPNDDAIVIKSSLALGELRPSEDICITQCTVSGFDPGTMLDGTFGRTQELAPDCDPVTGRIKLGTESNGPMRRILIENCDFVRSRGLVIASVDGGTIEDVEIRGIEMREIANAPIFVRLGARLRGPAGTAIGRIRNIHISNVSAQCDDPAQCTVIAGLPGHPVEDLMLDEVTLSFSGSWSYPGPGPGTPHPERAADYPEPSMFAPTPASGLWCRHVSQAMVSGFVIQAAKGDQRPRMVCEDTVFTRDPDIFDDLAD